MTKTIIELAGRQYKISPGELLKVDSQPHEVGAKIHPEKILLHSTASGVLVNDQDTKSVKVTLQVESHFKDRKISVRRYKSKSRYRRKNGHRQAKTILKVIEVKD